MTLNIPNSLFDLYREACDFLIDNTNIGKSCTIYYPPKKVSCSNCTTSVFGGSTQNFYRHGGPAPFSSGKCPVCGGTSVKEEEVTDTINLRIYWSRRNWIKIGNVLQYPNADAQIIGYASDLPKLLKANNIKLINEQNYLDTRFKLSCEPFLHGFTKNRYFIGYIERV